KRNSLSFAMRDESARALVLAALRFQWERPVAEIDASVGELHGPGGLTASERTSLEAFDREAAPVHVEGDFPEWLTTSFDRAFGTHAAQEGAALAERAPIDLRVNILKTDRLKLIAALSKYGASEGPLSPWCVRIPSPGPEARNPHVEAEPAHGKGWFEVQ